MRVVLLAGICLTSTSVWSAGGVPDSEPKRVAEAYLRATTGEGAESGRELLLGGVSMDAGIFNLENGQILSLDPIRRETGSLSSVHKLMSMLDTSAQKASQAALKGTGAGGDDLTMVELSKEDAEKLMRPTHSAAKKLLATHPVLAYALRVGKKVYWHPRNPMRPVLTKAGTAGQYSLEIYRFLIGSAEGPRMVARQWGLKVVRFKGGGLDTGWKVLPASDWEPD
jgi:hypothetical protein